MRHGFVITALDYWFWGVKENFGIFHSVFNAKNYEGKDKLMVHSSITSSTLEFLASYHSLVKRIK